MFVTLTCTRFERSLSPVLDVLYEWLDSWSGIGVIERGMARQGYDLQLTPYTNEGRATFFLTGREHSMRQATGSAWEPAPWRAVQGAAWEVLRKLQPAARAAASSPVLSGRRSCFCPFRRRSRAGSRRCTSGVTGALGEIDQTTLAPLLWSFHTQRGHSPVRVDNGPPFAESPSGTRSK